MEKFDELYDELSRLNELKDELDEFIKFWDAMEE